MKRVKMTVIVCCVTVLGVGLAIGAQAQTSDDKTFITFSAPVELPGMTLPAGKYTFRLLDSPSSRHIVQVLSGDGMRNLTILLALPAERMEVTDDTVVTFTERAADAPPAIRYWYYPGDRIGHEFVYPKDQALRIARSSGQPVLSTETAITEVEEMKTAEVTKIESEETRPATAVETQARVEERPDVAPVPTTGRTELPRTASPLPLAGAIGLLSLGGAVVLRRLRRR